MGKKRRIMMSSSLNPGLKKKHGMSAVPIRSGDEVVVICGEFKGGEGKVTTIDRKRAVVYVERVKEEFVKARSANIRIAPSNLVITKLKATNCIKKPTI